MQQLLPSCNQKFSVEIIQNGKPVKISGKKVTLEKKEFQIKITLKNQTGVYMNGSFLNDYYKLPDSKPIRNYESIEQNLNAELNYNGNKELVLDNQSFTFMFYDKEVKWHRFDKEVQVNGTTVTGTKTITKFADQNDKSLIDLQENSKPVYLFFVATEPWTGKKPPKELGRLKLRINWK